jgi:predicted HTH domain antitoxin
MPESRNLEQAVRLYVSRKISLGKAAELAGTNVVEFKESLANRGHVRVLKMNRKDVKKVDRITRKLTRAS